MKKELKKLIGSLIGNDFVFNLLRLINRNKLLIIYYHRVVKKEELINPTDINMYTDIVNFDNQMKFIKEHYHFVAEEEVAAFIERGKFPDYSVWITFDDGYRDNYKNALPILKKYSIPATFFVTTGYVNKTVAPKAASGNDIFMNWQELKEALGAGIFIGAHTVNHRVLSDLPDAGIEEEISESKNEIGKRLGTRIISFAYPIGKKQHYCIEKCAPILEKYDFKLAVTTIGGFNAAGAKENNLNLKRMGVSYEDELSFFKFKISLGGFWQGRLSGNEDPSCK